MKLSHLLTIIFLLIIAGVSSWFIFSYLTGRMDAKLVVKCVDLDGKPLGGVTVSVAGREWGPTSETGECSINKKDAPMDTLVKAAKSGYFTQEAQLSVSPLEIKMPLAFQVNVTCIVVNSNGKEIGEPEGGVEIILEVGGHEPIKQTLYTNPANIPFPQPTDYTSRVLLSARKAGYDYYNEPMPLNLDIEQRIYGYTFRLKRGPSRYNLSIKVQSAQKPLSGVSLELLSTRKSIATRRTNPLGIANFSFNGEPGNTITVRSRDRRYSIPTRTYELTGKINMEDTIKVPSLKLSVACITADGNLQAKSPVIVRVLTSPGRTELTRRETTLNAKTFLQFPKITAGRLEITATPSDPNSDYTQSEPVIIGLNEVNKPLQIVFKKAPIILIQLMITCSRKNNLSIRDATVEVDGIVLEDKTDEKGQAIYRGEKPEGRMVLLGVAREGYIFSNPPAIKVDKRNAYKVTDNVYHYRATIKGSLQPISLTIECKTESGTIVDNAKIYANKNILKNTQNRGVFSRSDLEYEIGETIELQATCDDYKFNLWQPPLKDSKFTVGTSRDYTFVAYFQRIPKLQITLKDAQKDIPISNATVYYENEEYGTTDGRGRLTEFLPDTAGEFIFKLSADNYLPESTPPVRANPDGRDSTVTRYMLNITPLKYRIGLSGVLGFDELPPDSPIVRVKEEAKVQINRALSSYLFSHGCLQEDKNLPQNLDPSDKDWPSAFLPNYIVFARLSHSAQTDADQLSVDVYTKEKELVASAFLEDLDLPNLEAQIERHIAPEIQSQLEVAGYTTEINGQIATVNIGDDRFLKVGDRFVAQKVERDPLGRYVGEQAPEGAFEVKEVKRKTASLQILTPLDTEQTYLVVRKRNVVGDRSFSFTVLHETSRQPMEEVKIFTKTEDELNLKYVDKTSQDGRVEFKASSKAIRIIFVKAATSIEKTYPAGINSINDILYFKPSFYTLIVEVNPPESNITLKGESHEYSGTGRMTWTLGAGAYKIEVSPPSEAYSPARLTVQIPVTGKYKRGSADIEMTDENTVLVTISLPRDSLKLLEQARGEGKPDEELIKICEESAPSEAGFRKVMLEGGRLSLGLNQPERARKLYEKLLKTDPHDTAALYNIGLCYLAIAKSNQSKDDYERAREYFSNTLNFKHRIKDTKRALLIAHDCYLNLVEVQNGLNDKGGLRNAINQYCDYYGILEKEFDRLSGGKDYYLEQKNYLDTCYERVKGFESQ